MIEPIRIFIGFDPREAVAYHVACQSILTRASMPVAIYPLALNMLESQYDEWHQDGSNAFTYSRWLVPWLCQFQGYAIYMDSDVILRADVAELWKRARPYVGASVVKHDYQTKHPVKYLGAKNEDYPRKNWSSVILWNCGHYPNHVLTPGYVGNATGAQLHRFAWLKDDEIENLPQGWNHLVGEFERDDMASLLHFTIGTPCFPGYEQQEGADEWRAELKAAMTPLEA